MVRIIYALQDPRDFVVKYVGMSANPHQRFKEHCNHTNKANTISKSLWVKELKTIGLKPLLVILEDASAHPNPLDREDFYVANYSPVFNKYKASRSKGCFKIITKRENYTTRSREQWKKDISTPVEVTFPDKSIKVFSSINETALSLGLRRKKVEELLAGYRHHGKGKIHKVTHWHNHLFKYNKP